MKLLVAALVAIVLWQVFGRSAFGPKEVPVRAGTGEVVLYATDWCPYCRQARALLAEKGVAYTEYDIEKSPEGKRLYDALGVKGVPVLDVNGTVVRGFDRGAILAALRKG